MLTRHKLSALFAASALSLCVATAKETKAPAFVPEVPARAAAPWTAVPKDEPDTIRFAVIGDRTGLARPGVFEQGVRQADGLRPEFIINVGDLLEGYSSDPAEIAREWGEIDGALAGLKAPFFFVAGNHDLGNQLMLDAWRARRGEPYYAFTWKGALFLVLDTEDPPVDMPPAFAAQFHALAAAMRTNPVETEKKLAEILARVNDDRASGQSDPAMKAMEGARFSDRQVDWALDVLKRHRDARWTFVLMHKPAWKLGSDAFARIEAALGERSYTVIAGHNHYYKHEVRNGRDYISMGTAGAVSHEHGAGEMDHIALVTLGKDAPDISLLKLTGILDRKGESGQTLAK